MPQLVTAESRSQENLEDPNEPAQRREEIRQRGSLRETGTEHRGVRVMQCSLKFKVANNQMRFKFRVEGLNSLTVRYQGVVYSKGIGSNWNRPCSLSRVLF